MRVQVLISVFVGLTLILVGLVFACSPRANIQNNRNLPEPTPTSHPTVSAEEMRLRQDATRRALTRESKWARVEDLQELSLTPLRSELRVWVGFDGAETPCFIVRTDGTQKNATLISAKFTPRDGRVTVTPVRKQLAAPLSGWSSFEAYLKQNGVMNPLKFSLDDVHQIDPDEGSIVIETKSDSAYSMVFFPLGTETEDGKRALQICRKVEQEFRISMRCSEPRS